MRGYELNKDNVFYSIDTNNDSSIMFKNAAVHTIKDISINESFYKFESRLRNTKAGNIEARNTIHLSVSDDSNNLDNRSVESYKDRVYECLEHLYTNYGISINEDSLFLTKIEINKNIRLNHEFKKYEILLNCLTYAMCRANKIKPAIWYDCLKRGFDAETYLIKNSTTELKLYNKLKFLDDNCINTGFLKNVKGILRIEYTLTHKNIELCLSSRKVSELNEDSMKKYFKNHIEKDIIKNFNNWYAETYKDMKHTLNTVKFVKNERYWCTKFMNIHDEQVAIKHVPLIFDEVDVKKALKELDKANYNNPYKNFKKYIKDRDSVQNNKKFLQEILSKI